MELGLELRNITVPYGDKIAVDGVNLYCEKASITAILGPSGCGKSSLLRAICGLAKCGGNIIFGGQEYGLLPTYKRGFVLMFQDGQLFRNKNVSKNISYGLEQLRPKMSKVEIRDRVAELLEMVELSGYGLRDITTLSGGQAGRVALARALAPKPKVLLLDEPLAALDTVLRETLSLTIRNTVKRHETTAIYVTHDRQEACNVADQIAIMHEGKIAQIGTWQELQANPINKNVAKIIGAN